MRIIIVNIKRSIMCVCTFQYLPLYFQTLYIVVNVFIFLAVNLNLIQLLTISVKLIFYSINLHEKIKKNLTKFD